MKFFAYNLVSFVVFFCSFALVYSAEELAPLSALRVDGEIAVELKDPSLSSFNSLSCSLKKDGVILRKNSAFSESSGIMLAEVEDDGIADALVKLKNNPAVKYAEPNYIYRAFGKPNDPMFNRQWNLKKIKMEAAWNLATGKNVTVAVIDTGVAYENYGKFKKIEDFDKTSFVSPYNFVNDTSHANDDNGHGSHVAGTIAQSTNNGKGVAGIAFSASIMPLKVLNSMGIGSISDIAEAVKYAADNGADVINLSLGGRTGSRILEGACKYAKKKGCVIVCAAGNDGGNFPNYPAGYKYCISVSAVRYDNLLAPYSSRGSSIDIAAPGGDMTVDQDKDGYPDGILQNTIKKANPSEEEYALYQGTSMASPHVAGAAALLKSVGVKKPDKVVEILKKTAYSKGLNLDEGYGAGILDVEKALKTAKILDMDQCQGFSFLNVKRKSAVQECLILLVAFLGVAFFRKRLEKQPYINAFTASVPFVLGIIFGACGLFFLPESLISRIPLLSLVSRGLYEWYIPLFGDNLFLGFIFNCAILPFSLLFLSMPFAALRKFSAGVSLGTASALALSFYWGLSAVSILGGLALIKLIWLAINALICFVISFLYIRFFSDKK